MPLGVMISMVIEPSMTSWAYWMPSMRFCFWLMTEATSSVAFTSPPLISRKWECPLLNSCSTISLVLLILPTVTMA